VTFKVLIDDNFHYMDESERHAAGEFASLKEALGAAQTIVDEDLSSTYQPGMSLAELWTSYAMFGEDPFIVSPEPGGVAFSAREYARQRAAELCAGTVEAAPPTWACACENLFVDHTGLTQVDRFADRHDCEVSLSACRQCSRVWMEYRVEEPHHAGSARWWRAQVADESRSMVTPERARTYLQSCTWCFIGGSYYGGGARREKAPIAVF
jgi:hypothetical protein